MNIVALILAGVVLGYLGYTLGYNRSRGLMVSIIIGIVGGFIGGNLIAPLFATAAAVPPGFNGQTLVFGAAAALALLFLGNVLHKRWDI
jgi:uncharacterized membrane protein YeaQ/YmgE (transglycosylase-associated protein family)